MFLVLVKFEFGYFVNFFFFVFLYVLLKVISFIWLIKIGFELFIV